jgi:AcrR family transcriptional regulator
MASSAASALAPRARQIITAALELLEEEGAEGLSMRRVAERVGIRAPSIYKHLSDKETLLAAIISTGFEQLAAVFEDAVHRDADDPLGAIASAYRSFARRRPHLYRLMTERPLRRDLLAPGVEERAALPLYEAVGREPDLARAAWAFAHGMTILELHERFPRDADLDAAWARGLEALRPPR